MKKQRTTKKGDRTNLVISILALIIGIIGLSIAFAVVTRNLVINGVAEIQGPEWDIRFTTQSSSASGGAQITSSKIDDQTISYHVIFTGPNQAANINFTMANFSSVNAKIGSITTTGLSDYNAKHINYVMNYADNTAVAMGDLLNIGASRNAYIHLDYSATEAQFQADAGSQVGMTVTIQYVQAP
jgi:hypothetical protein